MLICQCS